MGVDDIVTVPGYPRHVPGESHHVQTMLMFYYKTDCELCRAVNNFSNRRRRRRRQVQIDNSELLLSADLVNAVLTKQE